MKLYFVPSDKLFETLKNTKYKISSWSKIQKLVLVKYLKYEYSLLSGSIIFYLLGMEVNLDLTEKE